MKEYRLVKIGNHYVALSRGNAKPERSLEKKEFSMVGGDGGGGFERIPVIEKLTKKPLTKGDKIRKMNDAELAWLLMEFRFDAYNKAKGGKAALPSSQADIVKWLKEDA